MGKIGLVFLPGPGSHITSMVDAAKLIHGHTAHTCSNDEQLLSVTVLLMNPQGPGFTPAIEAYIQLLSSNTDIHFEQLPPVNDLKLEDTDSVEDFLLLQLQRHKPHVKDALRRCLSVNPVAVLVVDLFATDVMDVAHELSIPTYLYFTCSAASLGLFLHLPTLHEKISTEFKDVEEELPVPGIITVPGTEVPDAWMNRKSRNYIWSLYISQRFKEVKGIIVNTFNELEPMPLQALAAGDCTPGQPTPPVYSIGPVLSLGLNAKPVNDGQHEDWIKWLDKQLPGSVVFLCFGTLGSFDTSQVKEMAMGVESSGYNFLWCLRINSPSTNPNLEELLPEGFLERTNGKGMVLMNWAPQTQILEHPAVGGFVTHCGWNSILESLWFGVPMLPWPLFAEQHFNALQMVRDIGVAVKLKVDREHGGNVAAEELKRGIKCLMGNSEEGNRARAKAKAMQEASRTALGNGGSSFNSLSQLVEDLEAKAHSFEYI